MAEKEGKIEWPYWCAALFVFLICGFATWFFFWEKPKESVKVVVLGDSIYAEMRTKGCIAERLSEAFGWEIYNGAFGGTSLARSDGERWIDERMDQYSMAAFSKAIVSKDFSVQRQIEIEIPATEYFDEVMTGLSQIDFDGVEMLLIGYGMNDYQNGVPLDDSVNPVNEYTYGGALRSVLRALQKTYPKLRIILLTPTYSWYENIGKSCEEADFGGGFLEGYVELEKKIAGEYGVEVIDLYHDLYPHENFEDWSQFTRDGIHPNEDGLREITQRIKTYLEDHPR
ncbi:MAG: SGNH/GDSL hydrolase family protein [Lachnospiraceae bacterium]|nr:SGNH/GDSL hydrolase family protein [Lachnospiraceae bacterium]